ncbi:MAG TPA: protoporphyrinogen oxidase [Kofleriaceae bacterium]|jgi:oxygen-dependent protoporphyrinogen oxidase|nr:protoporphyrinogen oxidase [Kofleriaceae bacterium]
MKIAVVGGGLGGLAAARALVAQGHDAHVLEASERVGGVIRTSIVDGYRREHAASSFLGGPPHGALALCNELGVAVDKASPRARKRWIFIDGKLRALPTGPISLVRTDLLTWRGKLALLKEPFTPARDAARAGDESMHAFAARRFGPEVARAIIAPFVTGVYAADAHDVSLEAGFPRLAALDAAGGIVRGGIKQMLASRTSAKSNAAAAASPSSTSAKSNAAKTPRGMYAPVGGLGAMIDALAGELGERVHTGVRIRSVEPDGRGIVVAGQRWDRAVLALAAADAIPLVERSVPELAAKLAPFTRAPVALVYLGVAEADLPAAALDGFGMLVAAGEDMRVLGVVFESTVWPDRAPAGHALLRCIFGGGRDPDAATQLGDGELIATARRDVARAFGMSAPTIATAHASVIRWPRALAQYPVGHRERVREAEAVARGANLALAGADYRGPGINDLLGDGVH